MIYLDLLRDGGPIMWLILFCSVVAAFIFIEKWFQFHRAQVNVGELVNGLINVLRRDGMVEAITLCDNTPGPVARILTAAIQAYQNEDDIKQAIDDAALVEVPRLEGRLNILATIAYITPMLGLLGTIIGLRRGLSGALGGLIGTAAAAGLGFYFYKPFAEWISRSTRLSEAPAHTLAFAVIVIGVLLTALLLRILLSSIMKISFEGSIEKIGGVLAGLLTSAIAVFLVFVVMNLWPNAWLNRVFGDDSVVGRVVVKYTPAVRREVDQLPVKEKLDTVKDKISEEIK